MDHRVEDVLEDEGQEPSTVSTGSERQLTNVAGPEMDFAVGERVMKWQRKAGMMHGTPQDVLVDESGNTRSVLCGCDEDWNPSLDMAAAMEVESKIADLGLQDEYGDGLVRQMSSDLRQKFDMGRGAFYGHEVFELAHATPEQRCRAALAAIQAENDSQLSTSNA